MRFVCVIPVHFCETGHTELVSVGPFALAAFEAANVGIGVFLTGGMFLRYFHLSLQILPGVLLSLIGGFAVHKIEGFAKIQSIPSDLSGTETMLYLFFFSPILGELIFRFFLWQPIERLTKKPVAAWLITSALFAYTNLHAIWYVPVEFHPYIIYLTGYSFLLGLACGFFVFRNRSIACAMAINFAFNLGFYIASRA